MILLKADHNIKTIFSKLITTMGENVKWTDLFVIHNNNIILAGQGRSLIFNLDNRRVYGNLLDLTPDETKAEQMVSDPLFENSLNMLLYIFGKWGEIKGLKVEKNYDQLNRLINYILKEIDMESTLTAEHCRFYQNGIQITYEEVMQTILDRFKVKEKEEDGQEASGEKDEQEDSEEKGKDKQETSDQEEKDGRKTGEDKDKTEKKGGEEKPGRSRYKIGLWHNMCWKSGKFSFQKEELTKEEKEKLRLGNDFYVTGYTCPDCKEKLFMVVYPMGKEFRIETNEEAVYMARAYTCASCNCFYTPKPHKLILEGDVYYLNLEDDREAYEDYLEVLGRQGERTSNGNFNKYASEYNRPDRPPTPLEELCDDLDAMSHQEIRELKDKMDSGFYPPESVKKYEKKVRHRLKSGNVDLEESERNRKKNSDGKAYGAKNLNGDVADEEISDRKTAGRKVTGKKITGKKTDDEKIYGRKIADRKVADETTYAGKTAHEKAVDETAYAGKTAHEEATDETTYDGKTVHENMLDGKNAEEKSSSEKSPKKGPSWPTGSEKALETELSERKSEAGYRSKRGFLSLKGNTGAKNSDQENGYGLRGERSQTGAANEKIAGTLQNPGVEEELPTRERSAKGRITAFWRKAGEEQNTKDEQSIKGEQGQKDKQNPRSEYKEKDQSRKKEQEAKIRKRENSDRQEKLTGRQENSLPLRERNERAFEDKARRMGAASGRKVPEENDDELQHREIEAYIRNADARDRNSLFTLYNELKEKGYAQRNVSPFLGKLYDRIYSLDQAAMDKICKEPAELSFQEGMEAYDRIEEENFLPELKINLLGLIDKRLVKIKGDECEQLVKKLRKDLAGIAEEGDGIYFYDVRKMLRGTEDDAQTRITRNAQNTYAQARERYEYPILLCDTSFWGNGKEGFVLTPDHIFHNSMLRAGMLDVADIEEVTFEGGVLHRGLYVKTQKEEVKVSGPLKAKNMTSFAGVLNDFIRYLKEKPESRSISYLAKEKHTVKCCYRCGYIYRGGNVCPKCGSKNNE